LLKFSIVFGFGRGTADDLTLIQRTSKHIIELSLCGLGQVAPVPLLGMIEQYPNDFAHAVEHGTTTRLPVALAAD
jgi:NADH-quinone oxidoreductase subunit F